MTFYRGATITIGGQTFDDFGSVDFEPAPDFGYDLRQFKPARVEVSVEVPIVGRWEDLARLVYREPVGASADTLAKRVRYGGRKGRSALRRLRARAIPIEMCTSGPWPMTLRGKAVVLDEERLFVEMRPVTPSGGVGEEEQ